ALHAAQRARLAVQAHERPVIGAEVFADVGIDTRRLAARLLDLAALAGHAVHVGGGAAEVADDAGEAGRDVAAALDLGQNRPPAVARDDAPRGLGDRAEAAAAETAAHDRHRELDHLVRRKLATAVARMRDALIGQLVDAVHLVGGKRNRR